MACVFEDLLGECGITQVLVLLAVLLLSWLAFSYLKAPSNLPPGPIGIPLFGYLPFLGEKPLDELSRLAQKYGDVFSMYLGSELVVVLGSFDAIKDALVKQGDIFAGRIQYNASDNIKGIINTDGAVWREHRRFSLTTLRDFGFGKMSMEPKIKEEIEYLVKHIEEAKSSPTDVSKLLRMSMANVISSLVFGERFSFEDDRFQLIMDIVDEHIQAFHNLKGTFYMRWIYKIPGAQFLFPIRSRKTRDKITVFLRTMIKKHKEEFFLGKLDDYIDSWLTEENKHKNNEEKRDMYEEKKLIGNLRSLFLAGSDTTASTLRWGLLRMCLNPRVQELVQKEIDEIIGGERMPSMSDSSRMPYTEATILEIQRTGNIVPLSLTHTNYEETVLRGYKIPKRTVILPNLWAVHRDPNIYPDPEAFRPERFLDESGKVIKHEKLIPFSLGKRSCLGEALARTEIFLYFTSMLQRFTFRAPDGEHLCDDYVFSLVVPPKPYKIVASIRTSL